MLKVIFMIIFITLINATKYTPDWKSLDARPLPKWYEEAKIGIFVHWGVFSVPAFGSAWFWEYWKTNSSAYVNYMKKHYKPGFTYADFAKDFHAEFFDPDEWADIFKAAGARYVVLVTKHHEGYTLWPSKYSWNWNAYDVGPHRDLVGDLATAVKRKWGMHFGVYHSLFEFFNPLFLRDQANNFRTQDFVRRKTLPELYELVTSYKPDIVWSDGDWLASDTYWNSTEFLAWLYNESPVRDTVVVNDRWGNNTRCKHGGFWNCADRFNPGKVMSHKWENCMTLDKHAWTYRKRLNIEDIYSTHDLISIMAKTISCGGNLLINVGPTAYGKIPPIFEERLREFGSWLKLNGEAIYPSKPWHTQQDNITKDVWYTSVPYLGEKIVYAIVLSWPDTGVLTLGIPQSTPETTVEMLGLPGLHLPYKSSLVFSITFPKIPITVQPSSDIQLSSDAWVLKMKSLKNV